MKELMVNAVIDNLDIVMDFVNAELETSECSMKLQTQIGIAVEEIFINIANYAYRPEVGEALIRISIGDEIVLEFEDKGVSYNPLEKDDPDITKSVEDREIGGLGIFMVKKIMDAVEYRRFEGKNIFTIKKKML